jgi:hypothetical protein
MKLIEQKIEELANDFDNGSSVIAIINDTYYISILHIIKLFAKLVY